MKFVEFTGKTPFENTSFKEYLAFEDDITDVELNAHCVQFSIEYANCYRSLIRDKLAELSDEEKFIYRSEYIQSCIDLGSWRFITEDEWNKVLDEP